jgi:peroxiredoxin
LQDIVEELKLHNTTLVAITAQLPEFSAEMREAHDLDFAMLHDPGNDYAAELGIRFAFSEALRRVYADGFKVDLAKYNGDDSWTLPMPARLVVDRGGIVRVADIDPDYTKRPEPQKTLDDVKALD